MNFIRFSKNPVFAHHSSKVLSLASALLILNLNTFLPACGGTDDASTSPTPEDASISPEDGGDAESNDGGDPHAGDEDDEDEDGEEGEEGQDGGESMGKEDFPNCEAISDEVTTTIGQRAYAMDGWNFGDKRILLPRPRKASWAFPAFVQVGDTLHLYASTKTGSGVHTTYEAFHSATKVSDLTKGDFTKWSDPERLTVTTETTEKTTETTEKKESSEFPRFNETNKQNTTNKTDIINETNKQNTTNETDKIDTTIDKTDIIDIIDKADIINITIDKTDIINEANTTNKTDKITKLMKSDETNEPSKGGDEGNVHRPSILYENGVFRMWFGSGTIRYAESKDGVNFAAREAPVLSPTNENTFDALAITAPTVIHEAHGYRMWFQGFDGKEYAIGMATSPDGLTWTRTSKFPVLEKGTPSAFDNTTVAHPWVLSDGKGGYRMWYAGYDTSLTNPGPYRVGLATSADGGATWIKRGVSVDLSASGLDAYGVWEPAVIRLPDGTWLMAYCGMSSVDYGYSLLTATSKSCGVFPDTDSGDNRRSTFPSPNLTFNDD